MVLFSRSAWAHSFFSPVARIDQCRLQHRWRYQYNFVSGNQTFKEEKKVQVSESYLKNKRLMKVDEEWCATCWNSDWVYVG